MNFIITLKLNDEPVRYHYGALCSAEMIAGAEGACKKLSGKRNRFGQHSGEQYDCTEEVIWRAAQHCWIIFQVKGQRQMKGLLMMEKLLDLLFLLPRIFGRNPYRQKKQEY